MHEVEFSLGSPEILCALRFRHSLEVPEGLKRANAETEISTDFCDIACAAVKRYKIAFEDLDRVEAGCRDGLQFFIQSATNGNGCYRVFHGRTHPIFMIRSRLHRPSVSSVIDQRHSPQLIWRRGSKPEKLQISGNLFEQHVGADLEFAAARAYRGKEGRNLVLHHHFADEC